MKPEDGATVHETQNGPNYGVSRISPRTVQSRAHANMRVTLNLPVSLLDRMRNTVYWTPGLTLTALIRGAIQESVEQLEQRQGQPFPARLAELKSGRPRKRPSPRITNRMYETARAMRLSEHTVGADLVSPSYK